MLKASQFAWWPFSYHKAPWLFDYLTTRDYFQPWKYWLKEERSNSTKLLVKFTF